MEAIYAIDINNGLSKDGGIPWNSKKDLTFFANKTKKNVVIMGRNTYFSLPDNVRPLKNRLNIVLTTKPEDYLYIQQESKNNVLFTDDCNIYKRLLSEREETAKSHPYLNYNFKIFCIGGKNVYEQFIPLCDKVWVTQIKKDYSCDLFFNYNFSKEFKEPQIVEEDQEWKVSLYETRSPEF
jgi:dihydrofolate reductase